MTCFFNPCLTIQITRRINRSRNISEIRVLSEIVLTNSKSIFGTHAYEPDTFVREKCPLVYSQYNLGSIVDPLKSIGAMLLWYQRDLIGTSIGCPWSQGTLVSRTALDLIVVVIPVWAYRSYATCIRYVKPVTCNIRYITRYITTLFVT